MNVHHIRTEFKKGFAPGGGELGASVSVWKHGEEIMTRSEGYTDQSQSTEWTVDTDARPCL